MQTKGIDYDQTYASVVRGYKILLALAAENGWNIQQMDVETAFLNSNLNSELQQVYVQQSEGFAEGNYVCKLLKALYDLKQSPQAWYETLTQHLNVNNYTSITADASIFINKDKRVIIAAYVDDLLIMGHNTAEILDLKKHLCDKWKMKDLGSVKTYLGLDIERSKDLHTIYVSQKTYIAKILERFGFSNSNPVSTPMEAGLNLQKSQKQASAAYIHQYQEAIGSLMHAMTHTRPDIAYSVSTLAQFMSNPDETHWQAIKHVFRYLKGTQNLGITYSKASKTSKMLLTGWVDADYAADRDTRCSTTGYVFCLMGGSIT